MKRTRRLAGLGLAAATALAMTACADDGAAGPSPSTSANPPSSSGAPAAATSADPAAVSALAEATAALGTTSFTMTLAGGPGFRMVAKVDAPNSKGTAELTASGPNTELTVKSLLLGEDLYAQIPGITKAGTWTHLDMSRLPEGANVGLRPGRIDPVGTAQLINSTTDLHSTGARSYAGTVDLTKATGIAGLDQVTIDGYGPAAQRVPFTAGLDEQGRLSVLTLQLPQATTLEALYTDYGAAVTAEQPPAAQVIEAPEDVYRALGG